MCKCYPLPCPHECRQESIQRQNLEQHLNDECPLQEVECEFKYAGCEAKLPHKDMPDHLRDNVGHMTLLARQNQELMARLLEKDEQFRRTLEDNRRKTEDSIARLIERQQQDTEMLARQNELRARLVEKDEQIGQLVKQHRWEMDRLEEKSNKQTKRLSADAQHTKQRMNEIIEGQGAMNADVKATVDDQLTAIQQKSEADYTRVVRQVSEAESRRANSMSQMERRVTKIENSKAAADKVKQLKDRVEEVERSTTTKAEHKKLVQQSVTRREHNDLVRKQEVTDSSLKRLQGNTAPAAEVATLKNQLGDLVRKQDTVTTTVEMLHHHVHIAPVQIVMVNYEQHKRDNGEWFSDGFYTHPQGYKVCLKVYANGLGVTKGTHVSCFIYLMRGEFDNNLNWPFRSTVTITLLNQREDNNHHTKTVHFTDQSPDETTARVTSGERASNALGTRQVIRHSQLGYNEATNCQYLVNDCLYFRVKVKLC